MFGHMKTQPILKVNSCSIANSIEALLKFADNPQPARWIEFPAAILLFLTVPNDPESGAIYVLERKTSTWFWLDFEDEHYGGYTVNDFDLLVHEYDFLSLVERPGLLKANPGWVLEPRRSAEMAHPGK